MRPVLLAVVGLLLSANMVLAASPERAGLLERLRKALPVLTEVVPLAEYAAQDVRADLLAQNPGKEKVIEPIVQSFGACMAKPMAGRDHVAEAVAKADAAGMTEDELKIVIAFYEDPELQAGFKALAAAITSNKDIDMDPATFERLKVAGAQPAVVRFNMIMNEDAPGEGAETTKAMKACGVAMGGQIAKAGLTYD